VLLSPFFLYVPMLRYRLYFVGLYLCALLYIAAGINHFVNAEMYLRTMPPYLPAHEALVALSGVIEIVLGVALVLRPKTRLRVWAAWGIVLLLIAVFPANIQTYLNMKATADPRLTFALVRLPLQLPLIAWAWAYTRPMPQRPKK